MARFFVFFVVVAGMSFIMYTTKPTQVEYLEELERRAEVIVASEHGAFSEIRGSDPVDEMVAAQRPVKLLKQTRVDDYYVVSVFTTEYEAPGYGTRRIRTFGLFSTLLSFRVR